MVVRRVIGLVGALVLAVIGNVVLSAVAAFLIGRQTVVTLISSVAFSFIQVFAAGILAPSQRGSAVGASRATTLTPFDILILTSAAVVRSSMPLAG